MELDLILDLDLVASSLGVSLPPYYLLLEDGSNILLEDETYILLEEA